MGNHVSKKIGDCEVCNKKRVVGKKTKDGFFCEGCWLHKKTKERIEEINSQFDITGLVVMCEHVNAEYYYTNNGKTKWLIIQGYDMQDKYVVIFREGVKIDDVCFEIEDMYLNCGTDAIIMYINSIEKGNKENFYSTMLTFAMMGPHKEKQPMGFRSYDFEE